jgi:putative ATP-dependent endonuclease of the OLD family
LNVLIGKNNAGKSNVLSTIDLMHRHLSGAAIAGPWNTPRPADEFTDRNCETPLQIGIEFEFPSHLNLALRERLQSEAPHLERSIDQIKSYSRLTFVLAGARNDSAAFLFIQRIAAGGLKADSLDLDIEGINLLTVPLAVASELFRFQQETTGLRSDIRAIERVLEAGTGDFNRLSAMFENRKRTGRYYLESMLGPGMRTVLIRQLNQMIDSSSTVEEFRNNLSALAADAREKIEALEHRETEGTIGAFAGATKSAPPYATWLMKEYGDVPMLHVKETREQIGRDEAEALLTLKVTRGGPEQLYNIQRTVKSLLGVEVDAFQLEESRRGPGRSAEMDIDRFLVEANGAGVREALRLILDLELKRPRFVLIEEPEVHLHPGLEHTVYSYMRDKSQDVQMFVTTHSTSFVDSVSFQNIYLVSRNNAQRTVCQALDAGDGALKIPAELGLRLSTVFMYDRLVFVEGPSDEAVLRELAKTLDLDLTKANVGFVQMGGVRNFAHFAAQATLELLTRRNIKMWFVTDRDERDDGDVKQMLQRLCGFAVLKVLDRRELENYLLDPTAVAGFICDRQAAAQIQSDSPSPTQVEVAIAEEAKAMKDEVVRLRVSKAVLRPIHLRNRTDEGSIEDRLHRASKDLLQRQQMLESERARIAAEVDQNWDANAMLRAPGALILDAVARRFGVRFRKDSGDSARLARLMRSNVVPEELRRLLQEVAEVVL